MKNMKGRKKVAWNSRCMSASEKRRKRRKGRKGNKARADERKDCWSERINESKKGREEAAWKK